MTGILLDPQKYPFAEPHTLKLDEQMVFQQAYTLGGHFPHRNYPFAID